MEGNDRKEDKVRLDRDVIRDPPSSSDSEPESKEEIPEERVKETVLTGLEEKTPDSASTGCIPNWRERGNNVHARRIPTERNFRQNRNPGQTRNTSASCRGNWLLKCENSTVDEYGETEADMVWKAVTELHEADPTTYGFRPSKYSFPYGRTVAIYFYTSDCNNVENVLNTAKVIQNRIRFPYMMTYWRTYDRQMLFMFTPEEEAYRSVDGSWQFMR